MQKSSSHPAAAVLASVLAEQGVRHAVVSPGSRNAPLVLALHHHPDIAVHVTIDERAAAHHALGLALATWTPVPVVCTSGTAALNHGPALAEAFHARIPLLSITADRPQDVVGRGHGQTLTQTGVHAAHVVHHDVLDESVMDVKTLTQRARQALHQALEGGPGQSAGPVHLNVPFDEPLYDLAPAPDLPQGEGGEKRNSEANGLEVPEALADCMARGRVMVVAGPRPAAAHQGQDGMLDIGWPCLAERGAAVQGPHVIHGAERLLRQGQWPAELMPEAIVTVGLPPMSKALRNALAGLPHWHVGEDLPGEGQGWDVWKTLRGSAPHSVLTSVPDDFDRIPWQNVIHHLTSASRDFTPRWSDFSAWTTMTDAWRHWPVAERPRALHVANSASARYAQWMDLDTALHPHAVLHANRGVAGIDGCTSTALGWHMGQQSTDIQGSTWLVTGDVAFHYDANALLTDPVPDGLKIVVMNNQGGGIFRWLPGTQHEAMFERHFETPPNRTVKELAAAMHAQYLPVQDASDLPAALEQARLCPTPVVVDIQTPDEQSAEERVRYLETFDLDVNSTFS